MSSDPELSFEVVGHIRYLVVKEDGHTAKERIPLHVWNMTDETAKHWFYKEMVYKLRRKMRKLNKKLVMVKKNAT